VLRRGPRKKRGHEPRERADAESKEGSFVHGEQQSCKHIQRCTATLRLTSEGAVRDGRHCYS
jgi:hypothetical protein